MLVIEHPDAEVIAGAEEAPLLGVPDREGEVADEPRRARLAPALVRAEDELGVRDPVRRFSRLGESAEQLAPVVDAGILRERERRGCRSNASSGVVSNMAWASAAGPSTW